MTTEQYRTRSGLSIFLSFFRPHRGLFFLDLACALVVALIDLAYPIVSRYAMRTLLPQNAYRAFFTVMLVVLAAYAVRALLYFVITYWGHTFGIRVEADCALSDLSVNDLEMVVLPGGLGGVHSILACDEALRLVRRAYDAGKLIGAICAAPQILAKLGITDGRKATCYPGVEAVMGNALMQDAGVVCDGAVITGRAMGSAEAFGLALLAALRGEETAQRVAQEIVSCAR